MAVNTIPYICPSLQQQNLSIHPWTELPLRKLWDPTPWAKGPTRSLTPVHCVISRQTSVPAVRRTGDWATSSPWAIVWEYRQNNDSAVTFRWDSLCGNPYFQRSINILFEDKEKQKFGWAGVDKRTCLCLHHTMYRYSTWLNTQPTISPTGQREGHWVPLLKGQPYSLSI